MPALQADSLPPVPPGKYKEGKFAHRDIRERKTIWRDIERKWPSISKGQKCGTDPSLKALRRNQPCHHLDVGPPAYRKVRIFS